MSWAVIDTKYPDVMMGNKAAPEIVKTFEEEPVAQWYANRLMRDGGIFWVIPYKGESV
jgi:hypothetical protein